MGMGALSGTEGKCLWYLGTGHGREEGGSREPLSHPGIGGGNAGASRHMGPAPPSPRGPGVLGDGKGYQVTLEPHQTSGEQGPLWTSQV